MGTDALQEYVQIFFTDGTDIQGRDWGGGEGVGWTVGEGDGEEV